MPDCRKKWFCVTCDERGVPFSAVGLVAGNISLSVYPQRFFCGTSGGRNCGSRVTMVTMENKAVEVDAAMVWLTDELQHLIGSETTRQGVLLVFNMFQHPRLNRRLAYVIVEGALETIFTDRCFPDTFHKIHARSPRVCRDRTPASAPDSKTARKWHSREQKLADDQHRSVLGWTESIQQGAYPPKMNQLQYFSTVCCLEACPNLQKTIG